jgi:hypothetical protein
MVVVVQLSLHIIDLHQPDQESLRINVSLSSYSGSKLRGGRLRRTRNQSCGMFVAESSESQGKVKRPMV